MAICSGYSHRFCLLLYMHLVSTALQHIGHTFNSRNNICTHSTCFVVDIAIVCMHVYARLQCFFAGHVFIHDCLQMCLQCELSTGSQIATLFHIYKREQLDATMNACTVYLRALYIAECS